MAARVEAGWWSDLRSVRSGIPPLRLCAKTHHGPRRLSRLQRHILKGLMAAYRRTQGGTIRGHDELVQALGHDKSNSSPSLRTLEARGLIVIDRIPDGQANSVYLTSEGRKVTTAFE